MQKTITLLGMKNIFTNKPRKVLKRRKKVYDEQWKMYFDSELERKEFLSEIAKAEEDIRCGRVYDSKEVFNELRQEFGC